MTGSCRVLVRERAGAVSRRRRCAKKSAVRARVASAKVLRRRVRAAGAARAATAATAAAVTLAGAGTAFATPSDRTETVGEAAGTSGASPEQCPAPLKPSSAPSAFAAMGRTLFFAAADGIHGRELWKSDGTAGGHGPGQEHQPERAQPRVEQSQEPDRRGRSVVLHRQRRHPRPGVVEVGWQQGGHGPGQEHQPSDSDLFATAIPPP